MADIANLSNVSEVNMQEKELSNTGQPYPLSVVIATLGGDLLDETIRHLNQGLRIPFEILICVPEGHSTRLERLAGGNVRIVQTPVKGQVAQRAYGLSIASQPFVLQLDDDVLIEAGTLDVLLDKLQALGPGHAISPIYRNLADGIYLAKYPGGMVGWLQSLSAYLICGAPWGVSRMGVVSPAGIGYGVGKCSHGQELFKTEWLAGGCILCRREDLITHDYYPFAGKAFSEDLIHSILWRNQGVSLWVALTAECATQVAPMPFNFKLMRADLKAHEYVVKLIGGSLLRIRLWYGIFTLKQTVLWILDRCRSAFKSRP